MATKRNYQGVLERIKVVAGAHPQVNSVDEGRELEFDTKKRNQFPKCFIRTDSSSVLGGINTAQLTVNFSLLVMDRLDTKRSNAVDVLNETHSIITDILATLHSETLIRLGDNPSMTPLQDYQDTQTAGWIAEVVVYLDQEFQCYEVPAVT